MALNRWVVMRYHMRWERVIEHLTHLKARVLLIITLLLAQDTILPVPLPK